jgi:hypothetical protein
MNEPLERWNDDAPEHYRVAKAAYAELAPSAEQLERMLGQIEHAAGMPGAPPRLGLVPKAWYWLLPVLSLVGATWFWIASSRPEQPPVVAVQAQVLRAQPPRAASSAATQPSQPAVAEAGSERARSPRAARTSDPLAELSLLERARRVISKDPARALALAGQHQRRYVTGQFSEERELLTIEALVRLGRQAGAERRARLFRRAYPDSVHAHRLGVILSSAGQ